MYGARVDVWKFFILFAVLGPVQSLQALQYQNDFLYRYDYRDLSDTSVSALKSSDDHLIREAIGVTANFSKNWTAEVRPELRYLHSPAVGLPATDPSFLTIHGPQRLFSLEKVIGNNSEYQLDSDLERGYVTYQSEKWEVTVGRRPLGIGYLYALTIWNKFSTALINTPNDNLVFNPDLANIRYQDGEWSGAAIDIEAQTESNRIHLGQATWYQPWIELQMIAGRWWDHTTVGLGFAKDWGGVNLKGESLWVQKNAYENGDTQVALGINGAFNARYSWLIEGLYQEDGVTNKVFYLQTQPSRFQTLLGRYYTYAQIEANMTNICKVAVGPLINFIDGSQFWNLEATYSLSDNLDLRAQIRLPSGGSGDEFGHLNVGPFSDGTVAYPRRYSVSLRAVF